MTVETLLDTMDTEELTEWRAYFELVAWEREHEERMAELRRNAGM